MSKTDKELTTEIVTAYIENTKIISKEEITSLITTVHEILKDLD